MERAMNQELESPAASAQEVSFQECAKVEPPVSAAENPVAQYCRDSASALLSEHQGLPAVFWAGRRKQQDEHFQPPLSPYETELFQAPQDPAQTP